ncbi:acyl-CoA carboxylase subunit epsilon [Ruania halotolerans]|uniref:acyl-CoA carboxylase subunit epsilon n=1 Tax=Ruania halotolerans TaxID=2897773 RepID=UPI001E584F30|nr:acyl-CoA carboxylase subunit epsilon [Ruania halotolerans]UFU07508.1 acyl-CoA carboxylase subunit epsilon [Ruania halotolerans]
MTGTGTSNGGVGDGSAGNGSDHYSALGEIPSDLVRVVKGDPDEAELAALVAGIVAARAAAAHDDVDDGAHSALWTDRAHQLGQASRPGRGAWRWSALPR